MKKMKLWKSIVAITLMTAMCVSGLAGCGKEAAAPEQGSSEAQQGEAKQEGTSGEKEKLTVWVEKVFSEDANNRMAEALAKYSEDTGIQVDVEFINAPDFMTKLNAAVEAGTTPDISTADVRKVMNYYPNNPYMDVTDLMGDINAENPFMESVYDIAKIGDKFYFVPYTSSASLLYIRKDKMEAAGVKEVPKTWDELFELATKISDPKNEFYGLGMSAGVGDSDAEDATRIVMWNNGGGLFDADGNPNAANEASVKIFEKYMEMYKNGTLPEAVISWTSSDNNGNYLLGNVGIVINACTLYTAMRDNEDYKELLENTIVTNIPAGSDNNKKMAYLYGWGIHNTCKNPDAAKDLVRYLCSEEVVTSYVENIAPVFAPVFTKVAESDTWSEGVYKTMIDYVSTCNAYIGYPCRDVDTLAVASQVYNAYAFTNALNAMVAGDLAPKEALEQINKEIEKTAASIKK